MLEKIKKFFYRLFGCDNAPEYPSYNPYANAPGVDEEASTPNK